MLDGEPSAWSLTKKALPYAAARLDSCYDHSWPVVTWDPAVLNELDLSDAGKEWARQAVKDWRLAKKAAREAAAALPAVAGRAATAVEHAAAARGRQPGARQGHAPGARRCPRHRLWAPQAPATVEGARGRRGAGPRRGARPDGLT